MKRLHSSKKPIKRIKDTERQAIEFKPVGLWYGINFEWRTFCNREFSDGLGKYNYEIILDMTNILKISNFEELCKFENKYGKEKYKWSLIDNIDWIKVSKTYDGIEIQPYIWEARLIKLWYYGWDVASGCIWNKKAIKKIIKIKI